MNTKIAEYIERLGGFDKAEGTITQYTKGLRRFDEWLEQEELLPTDVTTRDLQRYLSYLKNERDYAPKTIRAAFVPIRRFYADLSAADDISENPAEYVVVSDYAPKRTLKEISAKKRREWMTVDEFNSIIEHAPAPRLRNRLLILFQYFTGLRRQEVCDIRLGDLDREHRQVQVRGKNGKVHTANWQPKVDGLLMAWLDGGYRDASPYARESEYLFVTESSPQLSGNQLNKIVKQAAENAGIQEVLYTDAAGSNHYKITSHTLRHSFAMHFLQDGGTLEGLSKLLAHSSVTTTEIYGEILEERAKDEYEKFTPGIEI